MADKEPTPKGLAQRFFDLCLLLLGGIIALWVALQFLAQFWGWIVLIVVLVAAIWALVAILRARRNRW
jgi:membrane protein YdbS with pleckstrin-like domain